MALLPAEFADLEPFADWDLATEAERYDKRLASTMSELQAFYDAAFPRLEAALTYLDQYSLDELPDEARSLVHVLQSLINISFPVEAWKQPRVPDTGAAALSRVQDPVI